MCLPSSLRLVAMKMIDDCFHLNSVRNFVGPYCVFFYGSASLLFAFSCVDYRIIIDT